MHDQYHRRKIRLAWPAATVLRNGALVGNGICSSSSVSLHTPAWDHHPARIACEIEGLSPILLVYPVAFFAVFLQTGLPEGNRLARLRTAPYATALWATAGYAASWCLMGISGIRVYFLTPNHGGGPGTSFSTVLTGFLIFLVMVIAIAIIMGRGFQPHSRKRLHRQRAAHQHQYPGSCVDTTVRPVNETTLDLANLIAFGVPALLIMIMTRGRLGYQPRQE